MRHPFFSLRLLAMPILWLLWPALLAAQGTEIQIHTATAGDQQQPAVTQVDDELFVAWAAETTGGTVTHEIAAQRFADDGTPIGGELIASSLPPGSPIFEYTYHRPAVAADGGGEVALVWQVTAAAPPDLIFNYGVFVRRLASDGTPLGDTERISTDGGEPQVGRSTAGGYAVAWRGSSGVVGGQVFADDGTTVGSPFAAALNGSIPDSLALAMSPGGSFVVVWAEFLAATGSEEIMAQRFLANGTTIGASFQVNVETQDFQGNPDVAMYADGSFTVAWENFGPGDVLMGRTFASNGTPLGGEFSIDSGDGFQPSLTTSLTGSLLATWTTFGTGTGSFEIAGRLFVANGTPLGDPFQVNDFTTGEQEANAAAPAGSGGNYFVVWESEDQDGDGEGVYGKLLLSCNADLGLVFFDLEHGATLSSIELMEEPVVPGLTVDLDGDGELEAVVESGGTASGSFQLRESDGDLDTDVVVVGTFGGGQVFGTVDVDGDGELEIVAEDPSASDRTAAQHDLDGDLDLDLLFVAAPGKTEIFGPADLDGDGELELLVADTTASPRTVVQLDLDADLDRDVYFIAAPGDSSLFGIADIDGDGEGEAIAADVDSVQGTVAQLDLDADLDRDVYFVATPNKGTIFGTADLDDDGELELLIDNRDSAAAPQTVAQLDVDADLDRDVLFVSVPEGGGVAGRVDVDGDGELEMVVNDNDSALSPQSVTQLDLDADLDRDALFIAIHPKGSAVAAADPDGDGEAEVIVEDPNLSPQGIVQRDLDADLDRDVIFIAIPNGGRVAGGRDLEGDCDLELVVEDPALSAGTASIHDLDADLDRDVVFVATPGGGQVAGFADPDGDGEDEIVVEDPTGTAGDVQQDDLDTDLDRDLIFVATPGGGRVAGLADPDGDGEGEVVAEDPTDTAGSVQQSDLDADLDLDVVFVASPGGGRIVGLADFDGDGETEIVAEDPTSPARVLAQVDADVDLDEDILFIATPGGGQVAGIGDVDGDGEVEILTEDPTGSAQTVAQVDGDVDLDTDVLFAATPGGGEVVGLSDPDGDGELEVVVQDPAGNPSTVIQRDVDADLDRDVLFVAAGAGGEVVCTADLEADGELELIVEQPIGSPGLVLRDIDADLDSDLAFVVLGIDDLIFADSFESNNTSAWDNSSDSGGKLSVSAAAALHGSLGLAVTLDGINNFPGQLIDNSPLAENRYRVRFYLDTNGLSMGASDQLTLLVGQHLFANGSRIRLLNLALKPDPQSSDGYLLQLRIRRDDNSDLVTVPFSIKDIPHAVELDWRQASGPGANDGGVDVWVDGSLELSVSGLDNDERGMDKVKFGVQASDPGTTGIFYLDGFESHRYTLIGP